MRALGVFENAAFDLRKGKSDRAAAEQNGIHGGELIPIGLFVLTHKILMQRAYHDHMAAAHQDKIKGEKPDNGCIMVAKPRRF